MKDFAKILGGLKPPSPPANAPPGARCGPTWHGLYDECPVVEGGDCFLEAAEGVGEGDVDGVDEVCSVRPLEGGMLLLVQNDDDVAGLHAGLLVALAGKRDLLTVGHALVH